MVKAPSHAAHHVTRLHSARYQLQVCSLLVLFSGEDTHHAGGTGSMQARSCHLACCGQSCRDSNILWTSCGICATELGASPCQQLLDGNQTWTCQARYLGNAMQELPSVQGHGSQLPCSSSRGQGSEKLQRPCVDQLMLHMHGLQLCKAAC